MDEIPQLDQNDNLYLTHSLLPSTSLHPPSPVDQPREESQTASNIDWVSFFSDLMEFGDQKSSPPNVSISAGNGGKNKGKVSKNYKKAIIPPRIAFHTRSADDILDDGYRWRKYGQKSVKNNVHPRSYYRCTYHTCNVKKQIQRLSKDSSIVVTTYDGIHNHPCEKLMECISPILKQLQFLSSI